MADAPKGTGTPSLSSADSGESLGQVSTTESRLPTIDLSLGDSGREVLRLQRALAAKGFMTREAIGQSQATFGESTAVALLAFQRAHGLTPSGHLGAADRDALVSEIQQRGPDKGQDEEWDEETKTAIEGEVDCVSRYLWHGISLTEGPVLQSSAKAQMRGLSLLVWTNYVLADDPNQRKLTELDLEIGYAWHSRRWALRPEIDVTHYFVPFLRGDVRTEITAGATLSVLLGAHISAVTSHHVNLAPHAGAYFGEAGVRFSPGIYHHLHMEAASLIGVGSALFNQFYLGVPKSTVNVFESGVLVAWVPREWLYVWPHAEFSTIVDGGLRSSTISPTSIVGGLGVTIAL